MELQEHLKQSEYFLELYEDQVKRSRAEVEKLKAKTQPTLIELFSNPSKHFTFKLDEMAVFRILSLADERTVPKEQVGNVVKVTVNKTTYLTRELELNIKKYMHEFFKVKIDHFEFIEE